MLKHFCNYVWTYVCKIEWYVIPITGILILYTNYKDYNNNFDQIFKWN
jgi:hypothetical protein